MAKCKAGQVDIVLTIVSSDEVLCEDKCSSKRVQKRVSLVGGDVNTFFTFEELKELGAMLHDAPEFKSDQFHAHKKLIVDLGMVLADPQKLTRETLVSKILPILKAWDGSCKATEGCIKPLTLQQLTAPEFNELRERILQLQSKLHSAQLETAKLKSTNLRTTTETSLLDKEAQQETLRSI